MMMETKLKSYRENFPGYMGYIPYKKEIIGQTIGATNGSIKKILSYEPPNEETLVPQQKEDYSMYNKDYFTDKFAKDYPLEEENIYSNTSKNARTWVEGSKYEIYPQHIPGYKAHVPGIYSSNIHGMKYSKATAIAIKGDYCKNIDTTTEDRYKSTNNMYFKKPYKRSESHQTKLRIRTEEESNDFMEKKNKM